MNYMTEAITLAQQAFYEDEVPVGAVIVKNDTVIARAHNAMKRKGSPLYHAEILALNRAYQHLPSLKGCSLYVTLEPCAMCAGALLLSDLSMLYFGAYDTKSGNIEHGLHPLSQNSSLTFNVVGGIQERACAHLLKQFFQTKRSS
jgi:tRNA(adenine34) deaminase